MQSSLRASPYLAEEICLDILHMGRRKTVSLTDFLLLGKLHVVVFGLWAVATTRRRKRAARFELYA